MRGFFLCVKSDLPEYSELTKPRFPKFRFVHCEHLGMDPTVGDGRYDYLPHIELAYKPPKNEGEHNEVAELNDMYACLRQLVPCKAILMDKAL